MRVGREGGETRIVPGQNEEDRQDCLSSSLFFGLLADAELVDHHAVALVVHLLEIVEKAAAAADKLQQPAAAVMVLRMGLEMLGEVGDAVREQGNLHFGGSGVTLVGCVRRDEGCFLFLGGRQNPVSFNRLSVPVDTRLASSQGTITAERGEINSRDPLESLRHDRHRPTRDYRPARGRRRLLPEVGIRRLSFFGSATREDFDPAGATWTCSSSSGPNVFQDRMAGLISTLSER